MQRKQSEQGFTLIEALIATFLFTIVIASVIGIYLTTLKVNRHSNAVRLASENARYISEYLSKEIRNGRIDYDYPISVCQGLYPNGSAYYTELRILNVDNEHLCFTTHQDPSNSSLTDLYFYSTSYPAGQRVNDVGTQVKNFQVFLSPNFNPYTSSPAGTSVEPKVTITGTVEAVADPQNIVDLPFQTSISIPAYDIVGN